MAASGDVLVVLRYTREKQDAFGLPAEDEAWLIAVNRGQESVSFTADCSAAGHGLYHGCVDPCSSLFVKL